jgi:hypothetical protein
LQPLPNKAFSLDKLQKYGLSGQLKPKMMGARKRFAGDEIWKHWKQQQAK